MKQNEIKDLTRFYVKVDAVTTPGGIVQPYDIDYTVMARDKDEAANITISIFNAENMGDTITNISFKDKPVQK